MGRRFRLEIDGEETSWWGDLADQERPGWHTKDEHRALPAVPLMPSIFCDVAEVDDKGEVPSIGGMVAMCSSVGDEDQLARVEEELRMLKEKLKAEGVSSKKVRSNEAVMQLHGRLRLLRTGQTTEAGAAPTVGRTASLSKVIAYFQYNKGFPPEEVREPLKSTLLAECGMSEWGTEYDNIEHEVLLEVMFAPKGLDCESLQGLICKKVASMIRGKNNVV